MKDYSVPKKLDKVLRKNKKAWSRKGLVAILTYTIVVILTSLFVKSMWDGYWRTHSWRFQSPVIFQTPLIIKEVKPQAQKLLTPEINSKTQGSAQLNAINTIVETPETEKEIVMKQPHGEALWKIYMLETTRGRNDWCRNNGAGFGGFGVKESVDKIACYPTFSKAAERANYWFDKLNPDKSLASALCQYNLGTPNLANCVYYQHFLSL